jgi:hypothetical protein
MNKITKQLQELVKQTKQLANNLLVKGRPVNENMTLNDLVPEVLNIASGDTKLGIKEITKDGTYYAYEDEVDGYSKIDVNIIGDASFIGTFNDENNSNTKFTLKLFEDVPNYGFYSNRISEVDLTNTKVVGDYGFAGHSEIEKVIAPNPIKVGVQSFNSCSNATGTIKISEEQTVIPDHAFRGCQKLKYELHDNITEVGQYGFYNCQELTLTSLPSKLETIDQYAFYQAISMELNEMPPLLKSIGNYAFRTHTIKNLKIYNACTTIGTQAFRYSSHLITVELGTAIKLINTYAFANNTELTTFTIHAITPPTLGSYAFQTCDKLDEIRVPASALETYKSASNWSKYADIMVGIEGE